MLADLKKNSFTDTLGSEHVTKRSLKIPSHLKRIATLPCEM